MTLLDFLFPRRCLGCRQAGGYFCADCLNLLSLQPERICPACQQFSPGGLAHPGCRRFQGLNGLTTVFAYKGLIKKAIKKFKYRFLTDLAADLVEGFLSFCGEDKIFSQFCLQKPALVPVPLHSSRLKWRGFNQAELLGKMIAQNLNLPFLPGLLIRRKKTKPQFGLKKEQRLKNLKNAFKINNLQFDNLKIGNYILFDDVFASGATLNEAAKVLKQAGAKKVWGLTLAR